MTYEEFNEALDTYYTFRLASEPIATGSPEERFRLGRLADEKKNELWNRLGTSALVAYENAQDEAAMRFCAYCGEAIAQCRCGMIRTTA